MKKIFINARILRRYTGLKLIKKVCFLLLLVSSQLWARDEFITGQVGYGKHSQDSMSDSSTYPIGLNYSGGFGYRNNFYEFELLVTKSNYQTDIIHDGQDNTLIHDQTLFNLSLNFYLYRHLYVRLGYGLAIIEQSTATKVEGASGQGLNQAYGLKEDKIGVANVGVGYVFSTGVRTNFYTQYEYIMMSDIAASQSQFALGFRWYLR